MVFRPFSWIVTLGMLASALLIAFRNPGYASAPAAFAPAFRTFGVTVRREKVVIQRVTLEAQPGSVLERLQASMKRLRVQGRQIVSEDGSPFVWRFATGFRLVDYVADGDEAAAVAFLDWAAKEGFTGVRVLSTLCCWFDLAPADGQRALARLLALAQARGLYLEVVGLARRMDRAAMVSHVRAIGRICSTSPACAAIELANENGHPTQQGDLTDRGFLRKLKSLVPAGVPVSMGSNCCGQDDEHEWYPGGDYITIHTDRSGDAWNRTSHLRELESLSARTGRFVVDDEPIGAGDVDQPGRRSTNPNEYFARGVLSRVFGVGATWHCEACLHATVPGPVQQASATAFIAGTRIVPDDVLLRFQNVGSVNSPVKAFKSLTKSGGATNTAVGAFSGLGRSINILALIGVTGDPGVVHQNGWRTRRVLDERPGVRVLEIVR